MSRRTEDLKGYYTMQELAALLKVTDAVIQHMARAGEIAHVMAGRAMRFRREDVDEYLRKRRAAQAAALAAEPGGRRFSKKKAAVGALGLLVVAGAAWLGFQRRRSE